MCCQEKNSPQHHLVLCTFAFRMAATLIFLLNKKNQTIQLNKIVCSTKLISKYIQCPYSFTPLKNCFSNLKIKINVCTLIIQFPMTSKYSYIGLTKSHAVKNRNKDFKIMFNIDNNITKHLENMENHQFSRFYATTISI